MTTHNITVYNDGRDVVDYSVNGTFYTILGNQCRDLPVDVANKLMSEYSWLKNIAESNQPETVQEAKEIVKDVLEENKVPTTKEEFERSLTKDEKYFCSMCEREFKNRAGLSIHLKSHN